MSLQLLWELQERLHTGAIAGINVIGEDFRLQKTIAQFEGLCKTSPIFAKIYETVKPLADPACADKAAALMEAVTLVDAVVCTQGAYQKKGAALTPLELAQSGSGSESVGKYSELSPLRDALTQKGSGRYEVVNSAYESRLPALYDFRLKADLVYGLGDSYSDMAELATRILSEDREALAPLLHYGFDPLGGGDGVSTSAPRAKEMARRVLVLERTAGSAENDFYRKLVEEPACPQVKEAAVRALAHVQDNAELLIHLSETEKGNVKKAALYTLGAMDLTQTEDFWLKKLKKGGGEEYVRYSSNTRISDELAKQLMAVLEEIPSGGLLTKAPEVEAKVAEKLTSLLQAIGNKDSGGMAMALEMIAKRAKDLTFLRIKDSKYGLNLDWGGSPYRNGFMNRLDTTLPEGINMILINGMLFDPRPSLLEMCEELYQRHGEVYLSAAVAAGMLKKRTDLFEQYGAVFGSRKEAAQAIYRVFCRMTPQNGSYVLRANLNKEPNQTTLVARAVFTRLDPRWLEVIVERQGWFEPNQLLQANYLLSSLLEPGDTAAAAVIHDYFRRRAKVGKSDILDLRTLARCGEKDFRGLIPKCIAGQSLDPWHVKNAYLELPTSLTPLEMAAELDEVADAIPRGLNKKRYESQRKIIEDMARELRAGKTLQEL